MSRFTLIPIILTAPLTGFAANAQNDGGAVAPGLSQPPPGHPLHQNYLTSTGETVPRPGLPQSSCETPLNRSIEQQDDRTQNSVCSAC